MLYLCRSDFFFFVLQTTVSSAFFVHFAVSFCNITLNRTKYLNCLLHCVYVCMSVGVESKLKVPTFSTVPRPADSL